MKPLYIFDLDGSLALNGHRLHLITGEVKDRAWFEAACPDDVTNEPVARLMLELSKSADIWIFTGRTDTVWSETHNWLANRYLVPQFMRMRKAGDHRTDVDLKESWLREMLPADRQRLAGVFEDRSRVVEMWRRNGVACFQVAAGDF